MVFLCEHIYIFNGFEGHWYLDHPVWVSPGHLALVPVNSDSGTGRKDIGRVWI